MSEITWMYFSLLFQFFHFAVFPKRVPATLYGGCASPISAGPLLNGAGLRVTTMLRELAARPPLPACLQASHSSPHGGQSHGKKFN